MFFERLVIGRSVSNFSLVLSPRLAPSTENPKVVCHQKRKPMLPRVYEAYPLNYSHIAVIVVSFEVHEQEFNDPRNQKTFREINFQELLHADDTLILAASTHSGKSSCISLRKSHSICI